MTSKIVYLCLFVSLNVMADDGEWISLSKPGGEQWYLKNNSLENTNLEKNKALSGIVQIVDINNKAKYYKTFIKNSDCARGYGNLYYNTLDYKYVDHHGSVYGGNSLGDVILTRMCNGGAAHFGVKNKKNPLEWTHVVNRVDDTARHFVAHNATYSKNNNKSKTYYALSLTYTPGDEKSVYNIEKINKIVCDYGYGKVDALDLDGNLQYSFDYVKNGKSVGSKIVDSICGNLN